VGLAVGEVVGAAVGEVVGDAVGEVVGEVVGADVGAEVGEAVGAAVGAEVAPVSFRRMRRLLTSWIDAASCIGWSERGSVRDGRGKGGDGSLAYLWHHWVYLPYRLHGLTKHTFLAIETRLYLCEIEDHRPILAMLAAGLLRVP